MKCTHHGLQQVLRDSESGSRDQFRGRYPIMGSRRVMELSCSSRFVTRSGHSERGLAWLNMLRCTISRLGASCFGYDCDHIERIRGMSPQPNRVLVPLNTQYNDRRVTLPQQAFRQQRSSRIKVFVHRSDFTQTDRPMPGSAMGMRQKPRTVGTNLCFAFRSQSRFLRGSDRSISLYQSSSRRH